MGTLLFQTSQLIRSSKNILVNIDTIKYFLDKIGERYSFKKKLETQHDSATSSKESVNEVREVVMTHKNNPTTQDSVYNAVDKDGLIKLFDQFPRLMSPMLD